ncbi:ABC transporter permease [Conyzicola sp.]|uniref:ABC transporter permease n=1 Tax=Conyzicola sp. TaxID=1969404 RepID=UPI003988ABF7
MSIVRATRAELAKIFTVRLWWILALVMVVYVGGLAGILAGVFGGLDLSADPTAPTIDASQLHLIIYSTASAIGYVFPVLLGALSATSESRHQTLTPTFLANPRRAQVLVAKGIAMALIGAFYGVVALVGSVGTGAAVLAALGKNTGLDDSDTWVLVARVVLAMALWAVIGVALGTLVPNQVAALVIVLAFTQFVEPILRSVSAIWEWTARVGQFLPGSASDALVGWSVFTSLGAMTTDVVELEWWQGGLVLFGIAAVVGVVGYFAVWKRDVT